MESRHKDCLPCRLVSGSGFIGIGLYLFATSQKRLKWKSHKFIMGGISFFTVGVGVARLFDLLPTKEIKPREEIEK